MLNVRIFDSFFFCSQGKVNKLGVAHVGCLVHGCFNASIPKPNLVSVETWRDAGPRIGAELEFEVTALDADTAGVLLIRGRLERTRQVRTNNAIIIKLDCLKRGQFLSSRAAAVLFFLRFPRPPHFWFSGCAVFSQSEAGWQRWSVKNTKWFLGCIFIT